MQDRGPNRELMRCQQDQTLTLVANHMAGNIASFLFGPQSCIKEMPTTKLMTSFTTAFTNKCASQSCADKVWSWQRWEGILVTRNMLINIVIKIATGRNVNIDIENWWALLLEEKGVTNDSVTSWVMDRGSAGSTLAALENMMCVAKGLVYEAEMWFKF